MQSVLRRRGTSVSCFTAATCLWLAAALLAGRAEAQDRVTVFGEKTVWRYHAVLRPPVVGTARQPAEGQAVGDNWVLRNTDFSSRPPVGNWTAPYFDDSRWLAQEGPRSRLLQETVFRELAGRQARERGFLGAGSSMPGY